LPKVKDQMEITKDEESSTKNKRSNKDKQRCGMKKQPPMPTRITNANENN